MSDTTESNQAAQSKPFDPDELAKLIGDDPDTLVEFTINFRQTLTEHREQIHQALEELNADSITTLAHRLKSSSRAMGAFALAECCQTLENRGKAGENSVPGELIETFDTLVASVINAIDHYLANSGN